MCAERDTWESEGGSQPQRARGLGKSLGQYLHLGLVECFWCGSAAYGADMVFHGHLRGQRRVCCQSCPVTR